MEFLIIGVLLGLIPAAIARQKGRSFMSWWFFGTMLFIVALPMALLMKPKKDGQMPEEGAAAKEKPDNHVPGWLVLVTFIGIGIFIYIKANGPASNFGGNQTKKAVDELSLYYLNNKIYNPVSCRSKKITGKDFILCTASNSNKIGGLYLIDMHGDTYTIYTVNGKAMGHARYGLRAERYPEYIDITEVLDKF